MIFGRRKRPHFWKRLRETVWPKAGIRRALVYISHRIRRLPGSPYSIAAGFACGVAVSFTPLLGFHFLLGALLAFAIGGNVIASAIGTAIGNPWTFPFIWAAIFWLGRVILGYPEGTALPDELTLSYIFDHTWDVFYPMLVGGLPTALAAWLIFFWPCYKAVARYQAHREARRARARERRAAKRAAKAAARTARAEAKGEQS
jgi:uncharacterized protein (DUF2062 family)